LKLLPCISIIFGSYKKITVPLALLLRCFAVVDIC